MLGKISYTNARGFFFIECKDPLGFIDKYFGLRSKVIRNPEWLEAGATCEFDVSSEIPKGDCKIAERINIVTPASPIDGVQNDTRR